MTQVHHFDRLAGSGLWWDRKTSGGRAVGRGECLQTGMNAQFHENMLNMISNRIPADAHIISDGERFLALCQPMQDLPLTARKRQRGRRERCDDRNLRFMISLVAH